MKTHGYIQPIAATQEPWQQLRTAKASRNFIEVGRLSAEIRTITIRNGQLQNSIGNSGTSADSVGGAGG